MDIDGKALAHELHEEFRNFVGALKGRKPCLAVIIVGDNPASKIYVSGKVKACEKVGISSIKHELKADLSEAALIRLIQELNDAPDVDGILVQLPLPKQINARLVTNTILPEKDVDGFHPVNLGKLMMGDPTGFVPCTPLGVKVMLEKQQVETCGKHAVVIGRSLIVGKPMAALLMEKGKGGDASVTVVHSRSENLEKYCRDADILIACAGRAHLVTADMVKEGSVVIDVGQNSISDPSTSKGYRLVGDVDYASVHKKCRLITPVPGGVGPMTIAMLLHNTLKSYSSRCGSCSQEFCCY